MCCYVILSTAADSCDVCATTVVVAVVATPTVHVDARGRERGEDGGGRVRTGGRGRTGEVLGRGYLDGGPRGLSQDTRHVGLLLSSEELGFREYPSLGGRRIRNALSTGGSEGGGGGFEDQPLWNPKGAGTYCDVPWMLCCDFSPPCSWLRLCSSAVPPLGVFLRSLLRCSRFSWTGSLVLFSSGECILGGGSGEQFLFPSCFLVFRSSLLLVFLRVQLAQDWCSGSPVVSSVAAVPASEAG
ncbi:hypothetical protein ACJJTC_016578 [Scirpophaga incertulas]